MLLRSLIALLFVIWGQPCWAVPGASHYYLRPSAKYPQGLKVTIIRDSLVRDNWEPSRQNQAEAAATALQARDWAYRRFREEYPSYPAEKFEQLKQLDEPTSPSSVRIVVRANDGSNEILATLKQIYGQELPLEKYLDWELPRPEPRVGHYAKLRPGSGEYWLDENVRYGSAVQVMDYVVKKGEDLSPLLHYFSEVDLSERSDSFFAQGPEKKPALPALYALYCDEKLVPLYRRMGFHAANGGQPLKNGLYVMTMNRDEFIAIGLRKFAGRPGYQDVRWTEGEKLTEAGALDGIIGLYDETLPFRAPRSLIGDRLDLPTEDVLKLHLRRDDLQVRKHLLELAGSPNSSDSFAAAFVLGDASDPSLELVGALRKVAETSPHIDTQIEALKSAFKLSSRFPEARAGLKALLHSRIEKEIRQGANPWLDLLHESGATPEDTRRLLEAVETHPEEPFFHSAVGTFLVREVHFHPELRALLAQRASDPNVARVAALVSALAPCPSLRQLADQLSRKPGRAPGNGGP